MHLTLAVKHRSNMTTAYTILSNLQGQHVHVIISRLQETGGEHICREHTTPQIKAYYSISGVPSLKLTAKAPASQWLEE